MMGAPKVPKVIAKALKEYHDDIEVFSTSSVSGGCINEAYHYVTNKGDFFVKVIITIIKEYIYFIIFYYISLKFNINMYIN